MLEQDEQDFSLTLSFETFEERDGFLSALASAREQWNVRTQATLQLLEVDGRFDGVGRELFLLELCKTRR